MDHTLLWSCNSRVSWERKGPYKNQYQQCTGFKKERKKRKKCKFQLYLVVLEPHHYKANIMATSCEGSWECFGCQQCLWSPRSCHNWWHLSHKLNKMISGLLKLVWHPATGMELSCLLITGVVHEGEKKPAENHSKENLLQTTPPQKKKLAKVSLTTIWF